MGGAFQTSREIFNSPIWQDVPKFRIFFYIVGNAVFSPEGVNTGGVHVARGQFLRSYRNLQKDLQYIENRAVKKYSTAVISRKIEQLVKEERLKIEDTELGTLFTVVNYDEYQRLENYKAKLETELEQCWNRDGTVLEQSWNNNKKVKKEKRLKRINKENIRQQIENFRLRYSTEQLKVIDSYLDMIRHTRVSGKIAETVTLGMYKDWDKHPPVCVEYGLKTHVDNPEYHSKKENYTLGIIRNTTADEAVKRLQGQKSANNAVDYNEFL